MSSRGRSNIDSAGGQAYSAAAMSLVFHAASPLVPTFRADVRYLEVRNDEETAHSPGHCVHVCILSWWLLVVVVVTECVVMVKGEERKQRRTSGRRVDSHFSRKSHAFEMYTAGRREDHHAVVEKKRTGTCGDNIGGLECTAGVGVLSGQGGAGRKFWTP